MSTPYPGQTPPPPYGHPVPPQPPKKNTGKIIGIGCGGLIVLSLLVAGCAAVVGTGDSSKDPKSPASAEAVPVPASSAPAGSAPAKSEAPAPAPDKNADVVLTASPTEFKAGILAQDGDHTSVQVTVVNNGAKEVDVNVLYFEVTTADGTRKQIELAAAEDQIDTVKLAKGEKVTGTITVKGKVTAKTVHFKNGLLGKTYSTPVK
ncbi:DUF4352 domain-containing protein [Streptomyces sp. NBC_00091]|uniref:DUF4352 domain-containing protein n=1 Tax=Streptomyces sp. NBC_00091 TaxID=2975648 RepID=UPI0022515B3E|nr:DUF4352 domain-containing protein [Streptomyces sp. NBC_00091]MCX5378615.1 DUF4352 domain-containing protein [Streptomyces sp. NBC_00091]